MIKMCRRTVGYVRSYKNSSVSCDWQEFKIISYCEEHNLNLTGIYKDTGKKIRENRLKSEFARTERAGIETNKWLRVCEEWENLINQVMDNEIAIIVVDTIIRLYDGFRQKEALLRICSEHNVKIIEAGPYEAATSSSTHTLSIYHYTINPDRRPSIAVNDIDNLLEYASSHFSGCEVKA